ncbi:MAG: hypothetical protein WAM91_15890 [Candidatus Acidiferrales bacterium]
MLAETLAETSYRIEISGWDLDESFFVENTDLEWSESEKKVRLQHALRKGALVFVRLLGESKLASAYPLAYEVLDVKHQQQAGAYEILLAQMHPRTYSELEAANG